MLKKGSTSRVQVVLRVKIKLQTLNHQPAEARTALRTKCSRNLVWGSSFKHVARSAVEQLGDYTFGSLSLVDTARAPYEAGS